MFAALPRPLRVEQLEERLALTATTGLIEGQVRSQSGDMMGVAGATVFLDANNNGVIDGGEDFALTDEDGIYAFQQAPDGEVIVRLERELASQQTFPLAVDAPFETYTHAIFDTDAVHIDLGGNGRLDVAVAGNSVSLLHFDGTDFFRNPEGDLDLTATNVGGSVLASGRLDGGTQDDLVAADHNKLHIFLDPTRATVDPTQTVNLQLAKTDEPVGLAIGDLDGDLDADVALLADRQGAGVLYLVRNDEDMSGGRVFKVAGIIDDVIETPTSVAVGNLRDDQHGGLSLSDLVVGGNGVRALTAVAPFSFSPGSVVGSDLSKVAVGDLGGDSALEIAVLHQHSLLAYDADLMVATDLGLVLDDDLTLVDVAISDIDDDLVIGGAPVLAPDLDIVFSWVSDSGAASGVGYARNDTESGAGLRFTQLELGSACADSQITLPPEQRCRAAGLTVDERTIEPTSPLGNHRRGAAIAMLTRQPTAASVPEEPTSTGIDGAISISFSEIGDAPQRAQAPAAGVDLELSGQAAMGLFRRAEPLDSGLVNGDVDLADFDNDGDLDAVVPARNGGQRNQLWTNDGFGNFERQAWDNNPDRHGFNSTVGDVDNDGFLDLVIPARQFVDIYLNDGLGGFPDSPTLTLNTSQALDAALADVNQDGWLDLYVASMLVSHLPNTPQPDFLFFNNGKGMDGQWGGFTDSGQSLEEGSTRSVEFGDIDQDGDLDAVLGMVALGTGRSPNRIYRNIDGQLVHDVAADFGDSFTQYVALGDIDADGDLDAVEASSASVGVGEPVRLWNNRGDGFFVDPIELPGNGYISSHAELGDLNTDGSLDIFVTNWFSQDDQVYLNQGDGTFGEPQLLPGEGLSARSDLGDIDHDGDLDAVVATFSIDFPNRVFLNSTRAPRLDAGMGFVEQPPGIAAFGKNDDVEIADLNGDEYPDIFLTARDGPNQVWINDTQLGFRLSWEGGGGGSFYSASGDIDSDGDVDMVVAAGNRVDVWLNSGEDAIFALAASLPTDSAIDVALVDVGEDMDGDLDLYVAQYGDIDLLFLNDGGTFFNSGQALEPGNSQGVEFADVNQDGFQDAVVARLDGTSGAQNAVWLNAQDGTFFLDSYFGFESYSQHVTLADLNGDNFPDAIEASSASVGVGEQVFVWQNQLDGTFSSQPIQSLGDGYNSSHVALVDFDQDGDLDLFVANWNDEPDEIYVNEGGMFLPMDELSTNFSSHVAFADLDLDGDQDAVVAVFDNRPNPVWVNTSQRTGENGDFGFAPSGFVGDSTDVDVDLADLNQDGLADAFITSRTEGGTIWLNDGAGGFASTNQHLGLGHTNWVTAVLGDINNDGSLDAIAASRSLVAVWLNDGNGMFLLGQALPASEVSDIAIADVDLNGTLDLYIAQHGAADLLHTNIGAGVFDFPGQALEVSSVNSVVWHDVDRNGYPDAVLATQSGPNVVWRNQSGTLARDNSSLFGGPLTQNLVLGDVNGDGYADALEIGLARRATDEHNHRRLESHHQIWLNRRDGTFARGHSLSTHTQGSHAAFGDLDLDGDLDLLLATVGNQPDEVYLNVSNGSFALIATLGNETSSRTSLGDIDGDGDLDAIVTAAEPGVPNRIWHNDGWLFTLADFNDDGRLDCSDIDRLTLAISSSDQSPRFDLNSDGSIDADDILDGDAGWLRIAGAFHATITGGNAFLPGDANLDGTVDGRDFIRWNMHRFSNTPEWCAGDFTADGLVDAADFIVWNANKFQSAATPMPSPLFSVSYPQVLKLERPQTRGHKLSTNRLEHQVEAGATPMDSRLSPATSRWVAVSAECACKQANGTVNKATSAKTRRLTVREIGAVDEYLGRANFAKDLTPSSRICNLQHGVKGPSNAGSE